MIRAGSYDVLSHDLTPNKVTENSLLSTDPPRLAELVKICENNYNSLNSVWWLSKAMNDELEALDLHVADGLM